jgi:hypothetical protein
MTTTSLRAASRDPRARLVRRALAANAIFSLASGGAFLFAATPIAGALALPALWVRLIGAGLLGFAALVAFEASRPRPDPRRVLAISAADLGWVLGSAIFLAVHDVSGAGAIGTAIVSVLVFTLGAAQIAGLVRHAQMPRGASFAARHCVAVFVDAPVERVWSRVADVGDIARWYPVLEHSELVDGVRHCVDRSGRRWSEAITRLDEEARDLEVRFRTDEPDFPFPVEAMVGGWNVTPEDGRTCVRIWWEATPKGGLLGILGLALIAPALDRAMTATVRAMAGETLDAPARGVLAACDLPHLCRGVGDPVLTRGMPADFGASRRLHRRHTSSSASRFSRA